jgi:small subunit ribosomal protein S1
MSWSRVTDPASVVKPGDEVEVKVLSVDDEKGKISLGLKQLQPDPWSTVATGIEAGQLLTGVVTRAADFGAFIEIAPGVEALAHVSTFPPTGKADGWKALVPAGETVPVEVLSVDLERKRIGVALVERGSAKADRAEALRPGARLTGKVERHESYGVFVFLRAGAIGLIPLEETGVERDGDLRRTFPVGSDVEVLVLEADPSGRRIRLSRKAVLDAAEKDEAREYRERESAAQLEKSGGFGSFADSLRKALNTDKPSR